MNDAPEEALRAGRKRVTRPRDAASLILLRGEGSNLEVLAGRRPLSARFMPGVYVFPGGAIDAEDARPWSVESASGTLAPRLTRCARAALRETWEETGALFGRKNGARDGTPHARAIERAYGENGVEPALDLLVYVGRAITPSHSSRRFNTRFFLGDGAYLHGDPAASSELDDVGWHPIAGRVLASFRDVTRFMLSQAVALRQGNDGGEPPLFYWAKNARRIGVCREPLRRK